MTHWFVVIAVFAVGLSETLSQEAASANVRSVPAPAGEFLSKRFSLRAGGVDVPVYVARVASADEKQRYAAMSDRANTGRYFDEAAFASFDLKGTTRIEITASEGVRKARLLPPCNVQNFAVRKNTVSFDVSGPGKITLEVNDQWTETLHIFVNPFEKAPAGGDPNVIYFGPGIHELDQFPVQSGKVVYISDGAIIRGRPNVKQKSGAIFRLRGNSITITGRGIIDGSLCPSRTRNLIRVEGKNIRISGVILRDSSAWNIPVRESDQVLIENVKILGHRANSDGIDICNSRNVTVRDCFIRTLDDLVVVKTDKGKGQARNITVKRCILWNEVAHALSLGAEIRENITDVLFSECDVLHDAGREWTLRVFHCGEAKVSRVRFENIRVADSERLISLWIGERKWVRNATRGHITDVTFKNVTLQKGAGKISLFGFDNKHLVEGVRFDNVRIQGKPLTRSQVMENGFVRNVSFHP